VSLILVVSRLDSGFEIDGKPEVVACGCFGVATPVRQLARCA